MGAFHTAIEVLTVDSPSPCLRAMYLLYLQVYGEEWAFYRTPNPTSCGVCGLAFLLLRPCMILLPNTPQAKVFDRDTILYTSTGLHSLCLTACRPDRADFCHLLQAIGKPWQHNAEGKGRCKVEIVIIIVVTGVAYEE